MSLLARVTPFCDIFPWPVLPPPVSCPISTKEGPPGVNRNVKLLALFVAIIAGGALLLAGITRLHASPALPQYTVVIDPGHGGKDPGAIGVGGLKEKTITLAIAKIVYIKSLVYPQLHVVLTRRTDTYSFPTDRVIAANKLGAALYVSIHANAYTSPTATGVETLISETRGLHSKSYHLAEILQQHVIAATDAHNRGVQMEPLFIRRAQMPAALVETGFITNPHEARLLQSISYQSKVADGILAGILAYLHIPQNAVAAH